MAPFLLYLILIIEGAYLIIKIIIIKIKNIIIYRSGAEWLNNNK